MQINARCLSHLLTVSCVKVEIEVDTTGVLLIRAVHVTIHLIVVRCRVIHRIREKLVLALRIIECLLKLPTLLRVHGHSLPSLLILMLL